MAYMFKYDSVHGRWDADVQGSSEGLYIDGKKILTYGCMCDIKYLIENISKYYILSNRFFNFVFYLIYTHSNFIVVVLS